jgi:hypothetical protein
MSRYQVKVTYRGQKFFEVDAASEREAEELAASQWQGSPIPSFSDNADILSIKVQPASDKPQAERPRDIQVVSAPSEGERPRERASEATIEAEVTGRSEETPVDEPEMPAFQPPRPSKRSFMPYLWFAFWIGVLFLLAQLGNQ